MEIKMRFDSFPRAAVLVGACALLVSACNTTTPMTIERPDPDSTEAIEDSAQSDELMQAAMFGQSEFKPIAFTGAISAIRHGTTVLHFPAYGSAGISGSLCNYRHMGESTYEWRASGKYLGNWNSEVGTMVHDSLVQRGFDVAGNPYALFESKDDRARAEFLLGARLKQMTGNACQEHHWWTGQALDKFSAEMKIEVDWIVYDPLRNEPVAVFEAGGYGIAKKPKSTGIADAFYDAWGAATEVLAKNPDFTALMLRDAGGTFRAQPLQDEPILVDAIDLRDLPIREYMDHVLDSTVTIRAGGGLGSGYLISKKGYVLTNQHVVGDAKFVNVVFRNGIEVEGEVLRRHQGRDVALIKVPITGGNPFPINFQEPEITEDVFAVGNPLKEDLKSTVTKGVVSAKRRDERTGVRLIQADVDTQGGNSGGPLLDTEGNVVAMSVAGYGTGDGTSIGINLFIPVASALEFLNIKVGKRKLPTT